MPENQNGVIQPLGFPPLPSDWTTRIETYRSFDDKLQLFSAIHHRNKMPARGKPVRVLALSHGIGEHGGRYLHFPHFLADTVDVVFCPDHRGNGRSEGLRGHVNRFQDFSDDFKVGLEKLASFYPSPKLELHVLGHSMGSLIVLNLLTDPTDLPIRSATLSSPLLGYAIEVPLVKRAAAGILSDLWGNLQMSTGINAGFLSHDPAVVDAYRRDRLVHSLCTPRLYTEMTKSMKHMAKQPEKIAYPQLFQVPMADKIVSAEAGVAYAEAPRKNTEAQVKTYAGFFHESYNETGKLQPFEDLNSWIKQHSTDRS